MKLTDLDPQFCRLEMKVETRQHVREDGSLYDFTGPRQYHHYVDTLAEAQGIYFLCPKCFETNGGEAGTHMVLCWFSNRGVPDEAFPVPGRWDVLGSDYKDLTLYPSVFLTSGCKWHGFITKGDVTSC